MVQIATKLTKKVAMALLASCFHTGLAAANALRVLVMLLTALCAWSLFEFAEKLSRETKIFCVELAVGAFMAFSIVMQVLWVLLFGYLVFLVLKAYPGAIMLATISCLALAFVTAATASYHERRMHRHRVVEWL